ncbi:hypothetical protein V3390_01685 [Luteimonas sp. FXH3W]|uniref:Uncharacterized protein n=1 Tax=Aquilutibacter rugosus TaxID=3115820 RepID=A0ABU7UYB2_9GAMM
MPLAPFFLNQKSKIQKTVPLAPFFKSKIKNQKSKIKKLEAKARARAGAQKKGRGLNAAAFLIFDF